MGRKLVNKEAVLPIFGDEYSLKAEVIVLNSFSGHADSNELFNYCSSLDKQRIQKLFLVHGELEQQEYFKERLTSNGFNNVIIPEKGDKFTI